MTTNGFLNFQARAGGITNTNAKNVITDFNLGGFLQLSGLKTNQLSNNYMGFARGVYYHQFANLPIVGRGIYAGASFEAGNVWGEQQRHCQGEPVHRRQRVPGRRHVARPVLSRVGPRQRRPDQLLRVSWSTLMRRA